MNIAYYSHYVGKEFAFKAGMKNRNGGSGSLKTQGVARALLKAGHKVTIYSSGIAECGCKINAFEEIEHFPEGDLHIKYPTILSFRHCGPINDLRVRRLLKKEKLRIKYDAFIFYNIESSIHVVDIFKKKDKTLRILEYEDNIFNKTEMIGIKSWTSFLMPCFYRYTIKRIDAAFAVCMGMFTDGEVKNKVLVPAVINEEVINNVSHEEHELRDGEPTRLFLIGGSHHCKGSDLLVQSLNYVNNPCHVVFYTNPQQFYSIAKEEIEKIPDKHSVEIRDLISHQELMKILVEEADILVSCTRNFGLPPQAAGFPSKMMEYAAMGRPIVSSEIGKLDKDFNAGITYYEGEDVRSLAACIDEVIDNYKEKNKASLKLQELAIREYSIEGISKRIDGFLHSFK